MSTSPRLWVDEEIDLCILGEQDGRALFRLVERNRAHLREWLPWLDTTRSVEDEVAFIRGMHGQLAENRGFGCGIWYRGKLAGTIGYHIIDWANQKVEIGYWMGAAFEGKGIMTRACLRMISYAFEELKLNKVEIRCAVGNTRSCAIPRRLGFTQEGVIRQGEWLYDHYVDLVLYGMLASEWEKQRRE